MRTANKSPLNGRTALVTGGGRGLGRAIALGLASRGVKVAVMARSQQQVESVADEINGAGGTGIAIAADISNHGDVIQAVNDVTSRFGALDILVNNAATIHPINSLVDLAPKEWAKTFEINLFGTFYAIHAVLPDMLERNWGRIVNISSRASKGTGIPRMIAYSTSKLALNMLSQAASIEVMGTGVCINAVFPGTIDTQMQQEVRETPVEQAGEVTYERFQQYQKIGRLKSPQDVAEMVIAIILSDINGEIIDVDASREMLLDILKQEDGG